MTQKFKKVTTRYFNDVEFNCYIENDNHNDFWATREQIGQLLGYAEPTDAIKKIHKRNKERLDKFSRGDILSLVEGNRTVTRDVIVYSFKGLLEICRYSNQPRADAVMDLLWDIADEIRIKGSYSVNSGTKRKKQQFRKLPFSPEQLPEPVIAFNQMIFGNARMIKLEDLSEEELNELSME